MNKLVLIVFLFVGVTFNSYSQKSLSDYSYVIVSEQFEFQKEKDKYQLNSLTKFLFNKYGFHAFFDREVPPNVIRCDGLWAEAEGTPGFIYTKVQLVLRDCNGEEVYRTDYGNSKIKDYKKAYYECVREAFEEIIRLNVNQKEIENVELVKTTNNQDNVKKNETISVVETAVVTTTIVNEEPTIKNKTTIEKTTQLNLPTNKYTNYSYMGKTYLLRKTSRGYSLYQELLGADDDLQLIGKVSISESIIIFVSDKNKSTNAYFDESNNLIIGEGKNKIEYNYEN